MVASIGSSGTAGNQSIENPPPGSTGGLTTSDIGSSRSSETAGIEITAKIQADQAKRDKEKAQDAQSAGTVTSTVGDICNSLSSIPYVGIVFAIIGAGCKIAGSVVTAAGSEENRRAELTAKAASDSVAAVKGAKDNIETSSTATATAEAQRKAQKTEKEAAQKAQKSEQSADALNVANAAGIIPGGALGTAAIGAGAASQSTSTPASAPAPATTSVTI